jgi:hypothetical protein
MRDSEIVKEQQLHPDITSLDDVPSSPPVSLVEVPFGKSICHNSLTIIRQFFP